MQVLSLSHSPTDEAKTFVSYLVLNLLLSVNACKRTMNPYILVDFCERDARTS